ncbi:hypothetical protein BC827DRAFT_1200296 [Russula dissimulans]|nr:hypothetical protein BC827DRAFT_1200296 [Russula dissimulans]
MISLSTPVTNYSKIRSTARRIIQLTPTPIFTQILKGVTSQGIAIFKGVTVGSAFTAWRIWCGTSDQVITSMANQTNDAPDVAIMTTTAATALNPTAPKALGPTTPPFDFAATPAGPFAVGLSPDVGVASPGLSVPVDPVEFVLGVVVPELLPEGGLSE